MPEEATQQSLSAPAPSRIGCAADDTAPEEATPEEGLSTLLQAGILLKPLALYPSPRGIFCTTPKSTTAYSESELIMI